MLLGSAQRLRRLLGNPALDLASDAPMKTRFKMWYRLVGSAVEHAARCAAWIDPDRDHVPDQVLDFGALFLDQEAGDEDETSLAEVLHALDEAMADRDAALRRPKQPFKAAEVAGMSPSLKSATSILLDLSDYAGATAAASELIKLEPFDASGYNLRALAYDRGGPSAAAVTVLTSAAINPSAIVKALRSAGATEEMIAAAVKASGESQTPHRGRPRRYATRALRDRAYRERKKARDQMRDEIPVARPVDAGGSRGFVEGDARRRGAPQPQRHGLIERSSVHLAPACRTVTRMSQRPA